MKVLLLAVNASYSHTNLAVRSLCQYVKKAAQKLNSISQEKLDINFREYTINQPLGDLLRGIAEEEADYILFSTYIWNAEYICKILADVKKILPNSKLGAGGPEFSYAPEKYFNKLEELDFIICGEGEKILSDFLIYNCFEKDKLEKKVQSLDSFSSFDFFNPSVIIRKENSFQLLKGQVFPLLDELEFPYPELKNLDQYHFDCKSFIDNKIFYYESSRGCPYKCSYCLSSLDSKVRFMSLPRVFKDLQIFLDAKVALVKFVDRTYNLMPERYIEIWNYILQNHNGKTIFHFEIEAEYLSEEAIAFLQKLPPKIMQFEIGVQSANKETLKAINRSDNIEKLRDNIKRLPKSIHQHLDLISALPYEDLTSFGKSFDFVMELEPDALQLGFLKILHGTQMEAYAKENNWKWMENPVYEALSSPYLSYQDILFLKDVEILLDVFYNSGTFSFTMKYIFKKMSPWECFSKMASYARCHGIFEVQRRENFWFEFFAEVLEKNLLSQVNSQLAENLLRYDFVRRGKQGSFPYWYKHIYNKDRHRSLLEENGGIKNARLDFAHSEYEVFFCDVLSDSVEATYGKEYEFLIRYK